jgi:hypothetical protein
MKTTLPAFMVRQNALTDEEWIEYIKVQAGRVKPLLNNLTLKTLNCIGIIYDDFGRHELHGYNIGNYPDLNCQGIFPPEDDRISKNHFFYADDEVGKSIPVRVIQRLWGFGRDAEWMAIEVRSSVTYEAHGEHPRLSRCIPTSFEILPAKLNKVFFEFVGLTPKQFWYLFTESIETLLKKRQELQERISKLESAIRLDKFQLSILPDGDIGIRD